MAPSLAARGDPIHACSRALTLVWLLLAGVVMLLATQTIASVPPRSSATDAATKTPSPAHTELGNGQTSTFNGRPLAENETFPLSHVTVESSPTTEQDTETGETETHVSSPLPEEGVELEAAAPAVASATVLLLATIGLYHRFSRRTLLDHPVRRALLDRVARTPGILPSQLAAEQGLTLNAVLHHVRCLAREGFVVIRRCGPARLVFPVGTGSGEREAAAALRSPTSRRLLVLVAQRPVLILDAATELAAPRASVHDGAARLVRGGLAEAYRDGPRVGLRATARGQAAVAADLVVWVRPVQVKETLSGTVPQLLA